MARFNFDNAFASVYTDLSQSRPVYESTESHRNIAVMDSVLPQVVGPQEEYKIQALIRPIYGKKGINTNPIGTPPDFISLEHDRLRTQKHYVVTLFVDIKGSTRLSLLYPLEEVYQFKNSVIQTCIETIRSLDGHVHRIMGDAVMAFFGGKATQEEDAIADAINCSITLRALLESSIKPFMEEKLGWKSEHFGFRVGIEFGKSEEVLWAAYGYSSVSEVTATGLPVDMASKLQGLANKNETMLGQGILSFINWPEEYSRIKSEQVDGQDVEVKHVKPNLTNRFGASLNYQMRLLDYAKCLKYSALPAEAKESLASSSIKNNSSIKFQCFAFIDGQQQEYFSASVFLDKNIPLRFVITVNSKALSEPIIVKFTKTNHGRDVPEIERDKPYSYDDKKIKPGRGGRFPQDFYKEFSVPEETQYRGLHTMKCEVYSAGNLAYRNWIGVLIK